MVQVETSSKTRSATLHRFDSPCSGHQIETRSPLSQPYRPLNGCDNWIPSEPWPRNQSDECGGMHLNLRVFLTGTHAKPTFKAALQPPGPWERSTCISCTTLLHLRWHQRSTSCSHRLMNGDPEAGTAPSGSSDMNCERDIWWVQINRFAPT